MNKFLKKMMTFGLCVGIFAGIGLDFAGCNGVEPVVPTPPVDVDGPNIDPNEDPNKKPDDEPVTPPVPEKKTLQQAETEFDAFMQKLTTGKNFTYTLKNDSRDLTAEFAGDKMKLADNGVVTYLTEENGENFVTELENDNAWHKDFAEDNMTIDYAISTVTDALEDVKWAAYDDSANLLTGEVSTTVAGLPITAQLEANFDQNDMSVKMKSGLTTTNMSVSKIGTTTVTLPENVIDETAKNNNIFTVDQNGEYVWNVKAIKEVLEPWLKNEMTDAQGNPVDNQFGRPVFARVNDNKVRTLVFVNPSKDKLEFGYILDNPDVNSFEARNIWGWDSFLAGKSIISKKEFSTFLLSLQEKYLVSTISKINLEYSTLDQDYENEHKQEFDEMSENIMKLCQQNEEKGSAFLNLTQPLWGYRTALGDIGKHGCSWGWGCIAQDKNTLKLYYINATISGLGQTKAEALSQAVNGNMENFSVWDINISELDKANSIFYEQKNDLTRNK